MARPTDKDTLHRQSASSFQQLLTTVERRSDVDYVFPEGMMNRNVRDVFMHLHGWHQLFLNWYTDGMAERKPVMPAEGYGWKDTPALNRALWADAQAVSFEEAKELLIASHAALQQLIEQHSQAELFTKKYYCWTGTTSLASYLISATSSHYDWAIKLVRKAYTKKS